MAVSTKNPKDIDRLDTLYMVFARMVALFFIAFTIRYWLQIVGVYEGANFRFDTMPAYWKTAVAVLGVLQPVAALGLWGLFSWGIVVWVAAVAVELVMYTLYPELFGTAVWLVRFHLSCLATYLVFRLVRFAVSKRLQKAAQTTLDAGAT